MLTTSRHTKAILTTLCYSSITYNILPLNPSSLYLGLRRHFRYFAEGREFHVRTDHKPLTYALNARPDRHSPRQIRHLDFIAQFTSDIRFVKGSDNAAVDALSRITINATQGPLPVIDFNCAIMDLSSNVFGLCCSVTCENTLSSASQLLTKIPLWSTLKA